MDPRLAMMFPAGGADLGLAGAAALPPGMMGSNVGAMSLFGLGVDPGIANVVQFLAPTEQRYQTAALLMQMIGSGNYGPTATSLPILYASGFEGVPLLGSSGSPGILSSLVSMFGAPAVQTIARQHRLIPMGMGHDLNVYDFMLRSQASADRLEKLLTAQRLDVVGYMEAVRGLANLAGVPFGLEQQLAVRNLITSIQPYLPMLSMLAPDLVDQLSGRRGSISSLGLKLIGAGRYRIDPITGRLGLSPETTATYIESIFEELLSDPTLRRSKGLSAGQLGALFEQLQLRGMLPSIVSSSYEQQTPYKKLERVLNELVPMQQADVLNRLHKLGIERRIEKFNEVDYRTDYYAMSADKMRKYIEDIKGILQTLREDVLENLIDLPEINNTLSRLDAKAIIRKLESYAGAVNAMKEVFAEAGFKNVPVEVAMRGIEVFTLGQAQKYTPEQIATMIRSSRNTANLTGTTIDNFILMQNHAAAVLRQANVPTIFANPITQQALLHTANVRGLGMLSVPSVYTPSDQELTQSVINSAAYFAASPIARIGAVALRLKEAGLIQEKDEDNELTRFVKEIERGVISEEFLRKKEGELVLMLQRNVKNPQANASTVFNLLRDQKGNARYIEKLLPFSSQTQHTEVLNRMTSSLMTEMQLNTIVNRQIENERKRGPLRGKTEQEVAKRRNELSQILSRRISEALLDEMSMQDFVDVGKRQNIIRQVIADTLKVQPSEIDDTLVAGLVEGAIPRLDQVIYSMSGGAIQDLATAKNVISRPVIHGALALRTVIDTRTEIQERLQHLGSSDSIIANIVTALQAATPTGRLNLTSLLVSSIGTQSIDEIVDNMLPVLDKLTGNLKKLEEMEKTINSPRFRNMSDQDRSNLLRQYESLKQGVLQSINEIDTISKRHGLDAPVKRAPSVQDTEIRFLQSAVNELALANLGYTLVDPRLAATISKNYEELGKYMPLSYLPDRDELNMDRPAPLVTVAGFEQLAKDKMRILIGRGMLKEGKILEERGKFVLSGLGRVLGLPADQTSLIRYNPTNVSTNIEALKRRIQVISEQGFQGDNAGQEKEDMVKKIAESVHAVGSLFGRWMKINDLAKLQPDNMRRLEQRIRIDLEHPESRDRLMRFLQTFVEIASRANNPNYELTEEDYRQLLASTIAIDYVLPENLMKVLRGERTNLKTQDLVNMFMPEYIPTGSSANVQDEQIFNTYRYKTGTGEEIKPFITSEDLKGKKFDEFQIYEANRLLASLYLDASSGNKLPKIEEIEKSPSFTKLSVDLQEAFKDKYKKIYGLDSSLRERVFRDFGRNTAFVRVGRHEIGTENLLALVNYSKIFSDEHRFDPTEMKNRLKSLNVLPLEEFETVGDPQKEAQMTRLLYTIHTLNRINFKVFDYIKDKSAQIKSQYKKDKLDAATLNAHLQNEVLSRIMRFIQPQRTMLGKLNPDLIAKSMEDTLKEIGGGQSISTIISRMAIDIHNISSRLIGPDGRRNTNLSLEQHALLVGMMDRLAKYNEVMRKYGNNFDTALQNLSPDDKQEFFTNILELFDAYDKFTNSEFESRMPGILTIDAEQFLRSPVLEYDLTPEGNRFPRQKFTNEQIQATQSALQRLTPEEARRSAMEGDVGIAQSFTTIARYFGLPVGPGVDLEKQLTERQKVALLLMTKGYNADTLKELVNKLPEPTDPWVRTLLHSTNAEEKNEAVRKIIEQFISDRATSIGISYINRGFTDRITEAVLKGGITRSDYLLLLTPFIQTVDAGSEEGRFTVANVPRMSARQVSRAADYSHYQNYLARYIRPILRQLFKQRGIDLKDDKTIDIVYQILTEKERTQPKQKVSASAAAAAMTPLGLGASGLVLLPEQLELDKKLNNLREQLREQVGDPQKVEEIMRATKDMNLKEELRNKVALMNPREAVKKLASPDVIGSESDPKFRNLVSGVKYEDVPRIMQLVTERNELIKNFSEALRKSMRMSEQEFERFKSDKLKITGDTHSFEQLRRLMDFAKDQIKKAGSDPNLQRYIEMAESNLQKTASAIREFSPTGAQQRLTPPGGASSQGGQQGPGGGGLLPSTLPGQGPGGQLGQNTTSPQQLVAAAEPRDMNINGKLIIEGLFGVPLVGRLSGKGQSSVPSRHPVSS